MLSRYRKIVTDEHALLAMDWAIKNWPSFKYRCEELDMGIATKPTIPSLLKGCEVAVQGYLAAKEEVHCAKPVQTSAIVGKAPDAKATKEQVLKLLDENED